MKKFITALHIIGLVLFFGSILGHAIAGLAPGIHTSAQTYLVGRQIVDVATWYLTLPGLVLVTLSGIGLVIMRDRPLRELRPHLIIVALILINALFILLPTGQEILGVANDLAAGAKNKGILAGYETREAIFGALNILACLAAIFIGVIKPGSNKT